MPGSIYARWSTRKALRGLDAQRLDLAAPVRLAVGAHAMGELRLPAVRADLHPRRRDGMRGAPLVAPCLRRLLLRDGHERLRTIAESARDSGGFRPSPMREV